MIKQVPRITFIFNIIAVRGSLGGQMTLLEHVELILAHMFFYKVCSTRHKLQNEPRIKCLGQN